MQLKQEKWILTFKSIILIKARKCQMKKILIIIFIFAVHISYLTNAFSWLDHGDIVSRCAILPLNKIQNSFINRFGQTGFYRPVVTIVNSFDYAIYGLNASGFHLTNVLIHILAVIVSVYFIAVFFEINRQEKMWLMLIFGVHPIAFLPIGAISYRQELLYSLFLYLAIYFYVLNRKIVQEKLKSNPSKGYRLLLQFILSFLLAILAKESAVVLIPFLIIFWEMANLKKSKQKNLVLLWGIVISVISFYLILRIISVPEIWHTQGVNLSMSEAIGTRVSTIAKLIFELFLPLKPDLSDATPVIPIDDPFVLISGFIFIGLIGILVKMKKRREWLLAFELVMILLLPAMNIIPLPRFSSPHYGYIALPAVAIILILISRKMKESIANGLLWFFIFISAYSTFNAGFKFKDDLSLFQNEVNKDNRFLEGQQYLGDYYFRNQEYSKAEEFYLKAIDKKANVIAFVDEYSVMNNLAGVYLYQGKLDAADEILARLDAKKEGDDLQILYNRAVIADKKGDYAKVIELIEGRDFKGTIPEAIIMLEKAKKLNER